jgi:hypothetical protein
MRIVRPTGPTGAESEILCVVPGPSGAAEESAESAFRANSAPARPTESITLRDSRHGNDVGCYRPLADGVLTHTASDVFVILKAAGRPGEPSLESVAVDHRSAQMYKPIPTQRPSEDTKINCGAHVGRTATGTR